MKTKVTVIRNGEIGVKDYIIQEALDKKDVLHITLEDSEGDGSEDGVMTMDPSSLIKKRLKISPIQETKFPGSKHQYYYVWYYTWERNLVNQDND